MYGYFVCLYVDIPCARLVPGMIEEAIKSPETGLIDGCEFPCRY